MRNNEKACTLRVDATSRFVFFHSLSCHCTRPSSRSQATNCQNFSSRTDANFFLTRDIITDGHGYVKIKLLTRDCLCVSKTPPRKTGRVKSTCLLKNRRLIVVPVASELAKDSFIRGQGNTTRRGNEEEKKRKKRKKERSIRRYRAVNRIDPWIPIVLSNNGKCEE